MRLYLSSYGVGNRADRLLDMVGGGTLGMVPNALDHVDEPARSDSNASVITGLTEIGIRASELDLRDFFGAPERLRDALGRLTGVWVRGGNTFVLRRAMRMSGFDELLPDLLERGFFYGGYSAGACVLAPSLDGIGRVDEPELDPYGYGAVIREGLGILPWLVLPHYRSDHHESDAIEGEVDWCRRHGVPFRTLRDGEVIVVDGTPG